jgi:hypothetical protein
MDITIPYSFLLTRMSSPADRYFFLYQIKKQGLIGKTCYHNLSCGLPKMFPFQDFQCTIDRMNLIFKEINVISFNCLF